MIEVDVTNNITRILWWDGDVSCTTGPFTHIRKGLLLVDDVIEVLATRIWDCLVRWKGDLGRHHWATW